MKSLRIECTGRAPVHFYRKSCGVLLGIALGMAPLSVAKAAAPASAATGVATPAAVLAGQSIDDFYKARNGAPLWLAPAAGDSAEQLLSLLGTANIDGLDPQAYRVAALRQALETARDGKKKDVDAADRMLSAAFVDYVSALKQDPGVGLTWVDADLKPKAPTPLATLLEAANALSLPDYVHDMGWMHPIYAGLRHAIAEHKYSDDHQREILELNLKRARILPSGKQRYVLVNAAQQRLYMYEDRKPVDSMVVVVGQTKYPTPMLAAYIRFAALNPYWYVPPDLAWEDVGEWVEKYGFSYFKRMGYEQVSDWSKDAQILDASKIDWKAVRDGKTEVLLRQNPGPNNFMGRIKFMFPNQFGVYLHDNPRRELFLKSTRYFSGGCVRLEDAWRLSRWLFHRELTWEGAGTEQPVMLAQPVPVYITYMTAMPDGQTIAYYDDAYGRDAAKVASTDPSSGSDKGKR
ncbi:MAG: L,D-transpeptidase family protein [Sphingomicrobium sp.]